MIAFDPADFAPGGAHFTALCLLGYLAFASLLAFAALGLDRRRAARGTGRVPEATLLTLAMAGGAPGAKLGQWLLRHRGREQPFALVLNLVLLVQAGLLAFLFWPMPPAPRAVPGTDAAPAVSEAAADAAKPRPMTAEGEALPSLAVPAAAPAPATAAASEPREQIRQPVSALKPVTGLARTPALGTSGSEEHPMPRRFGPGS